MDGEVIIVAVDASKEITDYALEWAVLHVAKAMDSLILLAVLPSRGRPPANAYRTHISRTYHFLSRLLRKWGIGNNEESSFDQTGSNPATEQDISKRINRVCVQMMQQLCAARNVKQVHIEVKVVANAEVGSVAAKADELQATWVILDRRLKKESDSCLKELNCNVVLIEHSIPKFLRAVNLSREENNDSSTEQNDSMVPNMLEVLPSNHNDSKSSMTPSSLSIESERLETDASTSLSSAEKGQFHNTIPPTSIPKSENPLLLIHSQNFHRKEKGQNQAIHRQSPSYEKIRVLSKASSFDMGESPFKTVPSPFEWKQKGKSGPLRTDMMNVHSFKATWMAGTPGRKSTDSSGFQRKRSGSSDNSNQQTTRNHSPTSTKRDALSSSSSQNTIDRTSSIRKAMSISIKHPPMPPPLCSVCKHDAPIFGKAPRKFSYQEIERATHGFSSENFLAEGGYGTVYKGVLPDGQVVAVKQRKILSAQGASEFCSEVEILSCAQHRNLVMLVGYCTENGWLLIYEFACNGSLDKHLYETNEVMAWEHRMRVAIGAARGLRYLHEDCRVGCIVHRDFRPNNILLTHDFEPMVGDFGLARWQADGQSAEETRVIGAFGYLAPEYTQTGLITEKADVYAFGVVMLELLCGTKATIFSRNTGKNFVQEWGRPLLEKKIISEILDPRLEQNYVEKEVECMMHAARLCISPHPEQRPRMSKVMKILEGDHMPADLACTYRQHTSNYPKQYLNNIYGTESPMIKPVDQSPFSKFYASHTSKEYKSLWNELTGKQ